VIRPGYFVNIKSRLVTQKISVGQLQLILDKRNEVKDLKKWGAARKKQLVLRKRTKQIWRASIKMAAA
jgi:hypothetical protein